METLRKQKSIDSFCAKTKQDRYFDWPMARFARKHKNDSILFYKHGKTRNYSTENLKLHFIKSDGAPDFSSLDGFLSFEKRIPLSYTYKNRFFIQKFINEKYGSWKNYLQEAFREKLEGVPMVKAWNVSIVGALIFGMFIMTFIYRYLGQGALAVSNKTVIENTLDEIGEKSPQGKVLGDAISEAASQDDEMDSYVAEIAREYQEKKDNHEKREKEIKKMVKGYPIEEMVPYIAQKDSLVAAFLVSIAKKESDWGKRVPVLDGEDCFNYWGYRGKRKRMGTGGHTCFDSPKDAVDTVAKRLEFLVSNEKMTTPGKMVTVWKCGYDCSWDNPEAVKKWVSDVDHYFKKFN